MIYTRKDYMNNRCTFSEFYGQVIDDAVKAYVGLNIGAHRILESKDEHFNDIPLREWDGLAWFLAQITKDKRAKCGIDNSIASMVCVAKEAAKQLKEEVKNEQIK